MHFGVVSVYNDEASTLDIIRRQLDEVIPLTIGNLAQHLCKLQAEVELHMKLAQNMPGQFEKRI